MKDFENSRLRSSFGLDHLFQVIDTAIQLSTDQGYPPYNIERVGDDGFVLEMAVAGFCADDLEITTEDGQLSVIGKIAKDPDGAPRNFVHCGISRRDFRRVFHMTDYVEVTGSRLGNGLLSIDLKRNVPEVAKKKVVPVAVA